MLVLLGSKSQVGMGWDGEKEEKRAGVCGWAGETDVLSLGRSHLHKEHLSFPGGQSGSVWLTRRDQDTSHLETSDNLVRSYGRILGYM